ncbi:MAG: DUF1275 domain-containing protein [Deltaproteobacteria bacterium]|nr:DUF1275 domain-containing protein [Deltaproteobacteria bacterium]
MDQTKGSREQIRTWPAFLLSWVGGSVDAIGFLVLFHMFVAHMSGNSAALGAYLGQGNWNLAFHHLFPVPVFVIGIAWGRILNETGLREGLKSSYSLVLGIEAFLLSLFMLFGMRSTSDGDIETDTAWKFYLLASLPLLSMGLQNATIRRIGGYSLHTTYITGVLNSFAEEGVRFLYWFRDHTKGRSTGRIARVLRVSIRQDSFRYSFLSGCMWSAYIIGAIMGSLAKYWWSLGSLVLPIGALIFLMIVDIMNPFHSQPRVEIRKFY